MPSAPVADSTGRFLELAVSSGYRTYTIVHPDEAPAEAIGFEKPYMPSAVLASYQSGNGILAFIEGTIRVVPVVADASAFVSVDASSIYEILPDGSLKLGGIGLRRIGIPKGTELTLILSPRQGDKSSSLESLAAQAFSR